MTAVPRRLEATLRAFTDRLFVTGGADPGDAALALPPARLALYRSLLAGNYGSMLRFAFTQALALVDRELDAAGDDAPAKDVAAVIARFLQLSPSRTHSIREIADRFLVFLPREYPGLVARRPDLVPLMELERAELRATFEFDDPGRLAADDELDALAAGSMDDLLERTVLRAPSASVLTLSHPVVELRTALERGETPVPPATGVEHATVARGAPPRFPIEFAVHAEEAALVFRTAVPGAPTRVESLAAAWFDVLPEAARSRDEAWKAGVFAGAVLSGLRTGFFRAT